MARMMVALAYGLGNLVLSITFFLAYPFLLAYFYAIGYLQSIHGPWPNARGCILFHAASLGEVNAIKTLIKKLLDESPEIEIVITTTSVTGRAAAKSIDPRVFACLSTLDISWLRKLQLRQIDPSLICIVETEIWPNLLRTSNRYQIPIIFISSRISLKTTKNLKKFSALLGLASPNIRHVYCQSNADAQRFQELGINDVTTAGNLKFAIELPLHDSKKIRKSLSIKEDDFVVCFGSSRPGEEELILKNFTELKRKISQLKLIIAPRHPKRVGEVVKLVDNKSYVLYSDFQNRPSSADYDVLIVDVFGMLDVMYACCDVAIVGGAFSHYGGHNPLEPAFYTKPIIMGPHHNSCKESVKALLEAEAISIVEGSDLSRSIYQLYLNPMMRSNMGQMARKTLNDNRLSIDLHLEGIRKWYPHA